MFLKLHQEILYLMNSISLDFLEVLSHTLQITSHLLPTFDKAFETEPVS